MVIMMASVVRHAGRGREGWYEAGVDAGFPGQDLIKHWPLPMEQPWFEDKVECPDKLWELLAW
jgi:hypothetical protein